MTDNSQGSLDTERGGEMAKHGTDRPVDRWDERAGKGVPNLSVVIPTLNRPDSLRACLSSLEGQTMETSRF